MVQQVQMFKTRDGEMHKCEADAFRHEAVLDLKDDMEGDVAYYGRVLNIESVDDLTDFLERNAETIKRVMGWGRQS